jgi:hypothetical protein
VQNGELFAQVNGYCLLKKDPVPWTWSEPYIILYFYVFSSFDNFVQCTIPHFFTAHKQQPRFRKSLLQITIKIYSEFIADLATSKEKLNTNRFKRINLI